MNVSARGDYALRALLYIASAFPDAVTFNELLAGQQLPRRYLESIMPELRRADFVRLWRDRSARYVLARPPEQISVGAVLRAVDGPFIQVRGLPSHEVQYAGVARGLTPVWHAAAGDLERLLFGVSLADVVMAAAPHDPPPLRVVANER